MLYMSIGVRVSFYPPRVRLLLRCTLLPRRFVSMTDLTSPSPFLPYDTTNSRPTTPHGTGTGPSTRTRTWSSSR